MHLDGTGDGETVATDLPNPGPCSILRYDTTLDVLQAAVSI